MEYSLAQPVKEGYYWATRKDLSFGVIVKIIFDEIEGNIKEPFVCMFGGELYLLSEFIKLRDSEVLWCGPMKEPKRK